MFVAEKNPSEKDTYHIILHWPANANMSHVMKKTYLCHMRTTKAQISLRIHAVWSAPLLFAAQIVEYLYLNFQDPS